MRNDETLLAREFPAEPTVALKQPSNGRANNAKRPSHTLESGGLHAGLNELRHARLEDFRNMNAMVVHARLNRHRRQSHS
jgi:hypothetical protein